MKNQEDAVRVLFFQVVEKSPDEWEAFLEQACGSDAALRSRVVELLQALTEADNFLEEPLLQRKPAPTPDFAPTRQHDAADLGGVGGPLDTLIAQASPVVRPPQNQGETHSRQTPSDSSSSECDLPSPFSLSEQGPGQGTGTRQTGSQLPFLTPCSKPDRLGMLGSYEILRVIGRGGMGIVLLGLDVKLDRKVAIKVLAPQATADSKARQRFQREARAAASVRHPNVVTIHAVDEVDGLPYLVMEYVEGPSLQHLLKQGPLKSETIPRIGREVASGLAAAHRKGLVHRDIKPANILLETPGELEGGSHLETFVVKVTDFGLARGTNDPAITNPGMVSGTPLYMSPEQARNGVFDHRSDQFSLGAVLYALCTGRSPFEDRSPLAVLHRLCNEDPQPVHEINASIPLWLSQVIHKLLARNPEERFASAEAVAEALAVPGATHPSSPFKEGFPFKATTQLAPQLQSRGPSEEDTLTKAPQEVGGSRRPAQSSRGHTQQVKPDEEPSSRPQRHVKGWTRRSWLLLVVLPASLGLLSLLLLLRFAGEIWRFLTPAPPGGGALILVDGVDTRMLLEPGVSEQLNLNPPQRQHLQNVILHLAEHFSEAGYPDTDKPPPPPDYLGKMDKDLGKILRELSPKDHQLLYRIQLRRYGPFSLAYNPHVANKLELGPDQHRRIKELVEAELESLRRNGKTPFVPPTFRPKLSRHLHHRCLGFLNPEQRRLWHQLRDDPSLPRLSLR